MVETRPLKNNETITFSRKGNHPYMPVKGYGDCPQCGDKIKPDEPTPIICWACDKRNKALKNTIAQNQKHAWCKQSGRLICWKDMAGPQGDTP